MLKRLQSAEPMYKISNWADDWQRKEELTSMITAYPEAGTAGNEIPLANKVGVNSQSIATHSQAQPG